jgi:hypothetical protein
MHKLSCLVGNKHVRSDLILLNERENTCFIFKLFSPCQFFAGKLNDLWIFCVQFGYIVLEVQKIHHSSKSS